MNDSYLPKAKVLVVDDQPNNIQVLAEALQGQYDVRIASSGEKALQIAKEDRQPDLILLDIMMPGMDGHEVCRRLKADADTVHIPVIFVTARSTSSDEELGLNLGAIDYISKPFNIPVVRSRVRNHVLLKQRADLLEQLASIDPLTHLPNRRKFESTFEEEWKRALREESRLSILLIDIDFFKRYNDHYGHGLGDICLKRVADAMQAWRARPGDMVARLGGEEFIVLLPNTDEEGAKAAGERIREEVQALQIPHVNSETAKVVSISVGCATCQPTFDNIDQQTLINQADKQLYKAKELGRNRVE